MFGHDTTQEYRAPDGRRLSPREVEKQQIIEELLTPLTPEQGPLECYRRMMRAMAYFVREHY